MTQDDPAAEPAAPARALAVDPSCPEYELVCRLASGDEAAFAEVYARHHRALVRLARVYLASEASAEDVAQETWIAVMRALPKFEGRASLKNWIFRILANRAKTRARKEGKQLPFSSVGGEGDLDRSTVEPAWFQPDGHWISIPRRWAEDTPERLVSSAETVALLEAELEKLPAKERAVVQLRDFQGWGSEEVCNVLEISAVYQRVLLHRGRSRLRHALAPVIHPPEGDAC